jgi:hypothetical protein
LLTTLTYSDPVRAAVAAFRALWLLPRRQSGAWRSGQMARGELTDAVPASGLLQSLRASRPDGLKTM